MTFKEVIKLATDAQIRMNRERFEYHRALTDETLVFSRDDVRTAIHEAMPMTKVDRDEWPGVAMAHNRAINEYQMNLLERLGLEEDTNA